MASDPNRCDVCGKPADVHGCEIRDGVKSEHSLCRDHATPEQLAEPSAEIFIRQAIDICQSILPAGSQSPASIAAEIRRLTERALAQFAEDARAFEFNSES